MIKRFAFFAVGCARRAQHLMTDQRSLDALDVAERYANGNATKDELYAAEAAAEAVARAAARYAAWAAAEAAAEAAARVAARDGEWDAAWDAARDAAWAAARDGAGAAARATERKAQVQIAIELLTKLQ